MGTNVSSDQFNVRWKNYTFVLQSVFRELLRDEKLVDITLACEGGAIKCHRMVLAACSPYFERILAQYPTNSQIIFFVKDLKLWELKALINFMYNGEVSIQQTRLAPLVKAAESLKIRGLSTDDDEPWMPVVSEGENGEEDLDGTEELEGLPYPYQGHHQPGQQPSGKKYSSGKSLLRNNMGSASTSSSSNNFGNRKILVKRTHPQTSPPKLVKMQKMDPERHSNGVENRSSTHLTVGKTSQTKLQAQGEENNVDDGDSPMLNLHPKTELVEDDEDHNGFSAENCAETEEDFDDNDELQMNIVEEEDTGSDETEEPEAGAAQTSGVGGRKYAYKYDEQIRKSALAALSNGISLRQCSETFGIPRKTISKWRSRAANHTNQSAHASNTGEVEGDEELDVPNPALIRGPPVLGPVQDASDRADRLKKATELALAGVTVRQAAAQYGIPRTTLCAYMKRRGLAGKRPAAQSPTNSRARIASNKAIVRNRGPINPNSTTEQQSQQQQADGFPFLGLSELVNEMNSGAVGYEEDGECQDEQDYEDDTPPEQLSPE